MKIRLAQPEDCPAILDIYNEAILNSTATFDLEPQTLAARQQWLAEHNPAVYPVLCLLQEEKVVGWASLSPYRNRPAYRYSVEFSLYIHKDHRGRGYGRALLRQLLAQAEALGHHLLIACVESSNTASLKLCGSLGFTYAGELTEAGCKFNRWLNITFMQKILSKKE